MSDERGYRFASAAALLSWHLSSGRASFGGLKAISYDRAGGPRDVFRANRGHALFALTTLCLASVSTQRRREVLRLAYAERVSDLRIAERHNTSETTVRRERVAGLREIEEQARKLAAAARKQTGEALLGDE